MRPDPTTLLLFEAGALDPAEAAVVQAWLRHNPGARLSLDPVDPGQTAWRMPPPGLGLGLHAGLPAVMSPPRLRPGDRHQLFVAPRADAASRLVVLLHRVGDAWQVDAPLGPDHCVTLDRLPVAADGRHRVDLAVRGPQGPQRLSVALPAADLPIAWDKAPQDRWSALMAGIADGSVPVGTIEIRVS